MSSDVIAKLLAMLFLSCALSYNVFSRYDEEVGVERIDSQRRFAPYIPGLILPTAIVVYLVLTYLTEGIEITLTTLLTIYFNLFIHISSFYAILIILLPTLRKYMSARSISFLWMIPNYLYLVVYRTMVIDKPLFVISLPNNWTNYICLIILIGAIVVLVLKMIEHFKYRFLILKDSYPITDEYTLEVWHETIKWANIKKPKFKLVCSPSVTTPLSIGLFSSTTKVVLPERNYTREELSYIFKHEIVHICRDDVSSKFFLVFCTAFCWYNPLMWIAMRKCSDDIELSCDETVLINMDDSSRREYANLILSTVSNEHGFTTCLSASASALKYRLSHIIRPGIRKNGALIVGMAFFLLSMSSGLVALSYDHHTGLELIFNSQDPTLYSITDIRVNDEVYNSITRCLDENAFNQYLSNLNMNTYTGNYTYDMYDRNYSFMYLLPEGGYRYISISDEVVNIDSSYYYLDEKIDWDEWETMIISYPAMNILLYEDDESNYMTVNTSLAQILKDGVDIYKYDFYHNDYSEICTSQLPQIASLSFSYEDVIDYNILVESSNREKSYVIHKSDVNEEGQFSLPNYPAHYTIQATLKNKRGELVEAKFLFKISKPYNTTW